MSMRTKPRAHPVEGWNERRDHPDGCSYWLRGERHRANGWAVDRESAREAWLFGHRIPAPDHAEALVFAGQGDDGALRWADAAGRLRATVRTSAEGVEETRYLDAAGAPERHRDGGHHLRRVLCTGEQRYYELVEGATPRLHRIGGPAIEDAGSLLRSRWLEHGLRVESPFAILDDAKRLYMARRAAGLPLSPYPLAEEQHERLVAFLRQSPESELAWELSLAFPDTWIAALGAALGGGPGDGFAVGPGAGRHPDR